MYLYIIFYTLVIIALGEVVFVGIKYRKTALYLSLYTSVIFVFILLSSLRWETGTDWAPYYNFFIVNDQTTFISWFEPGYTLMSTFISETTGSNYTVLLTVMAFTIFLLKASTINRYSIYPFFSILIWWSTSLSDIYPVRQTIASAIMLYSFKFIIEQKKTKFILLVCLAMTFHLSAIVFFPAYYLFNIKLSRKALIMGVLFAYLFAFFFQSIINQVLNSIGLAFIQDRILTYLEEGGDNTFGGVYTSSQILVRGLINKIFLFIPIFTYVWKTHSKDVFFRGWVNFFVIGTIIGVCVTPISPALVRISMYYDISVQVFIIPYLLKTKITQFSRIMIYFTLVAYLFFRFSGVVTNYESFYIPYKSIFYKNK